VDGDGTFSAVPSGPGVLAVRPPGPVGPLDGWEHWVTEGERDSQGTNGDVLRLVLTEAEGMFLRCKEVHPVNAQVPGTPGKRLVVVKSTIECEKRLTDPPSTQIRLCFILRWKNHWCVWSLRCAVKNTLTSFETSSVFIVDWWRIIWCILPEYFCFSLQIPTQAKYIPKDLMS